MNLVEKIKGTRTLATSSTKKKKKKNTDGSAVPNPGPSGAGVVLYVNDRLMESYSIPLGPGTNNIGELYGLGIALERADELVGLEHDINSPDPTHIYIVCDSSFAIGAVTKNFRVKPSPTITPRLTSVKRRWRNLADRAVLFVVKIKAHANLRGNVAADAQAGRASQLSSADDSWRLLHCRTTSFIYQPP